MTKKQYFLAELAVLLLIRGAIYAQSAPTRQDKQVAPEVVREAVFRHLFTFYAPGKHGMPKSPGIYFMAVGQREKYVDPNPRLLQRLQLFSGGRFLVAKQSQSSRMGDRGFVVDRATGKRGFLFGVSEVRWTASAGAEVAWWLYSAESGGMGGVYRLEQRKGEWKVNKTVPRSIWKN